METVTKKYLQLGDLEVYNLSFDLSNRIWDIVVEWKFLAQNSIGIQLVRSIDSISANIAEGFGRYGKKDKIRFYRISRASVLENKDRLNKSVARQLISKETHNVLINEVEKLPRLLNGLIKITNDKLKQ